MKITETQILLNPEAEANDPSAHTISGVVLDVGDAVKRLIEVNDFVAYPRASVTTVNGPDGHVRHLVEEKDILSVL